MLWLDFSLSNHHQFVEVGGACSPTLQAIPGVTQKSMLKPLRFKKKKINCLKAGEEIHCRIFTDDGVLRRETTFFTEQITLALFVKVI